MLPNVQHSIAHRVKTRHHEITTVLEHCTDSEQRTVHGVAVTPFEGYLHVLIVFEVAMYMFRRWSLREHSQPSREGLRCGISCVLFAIEQNRPDSLKEITSFCKK